MTDKILKFCEEYVANGYNGGDAYHRAYQNDNLQVCRVEACKMLQQDPIQDKIKEIEGSYRIVGYSLGIDRKRIMGAVETLLNAKKAIYFQGDKVGDEDDNVAINNGIVTYAKLTGDFSEKREITIEDKVLEVDPTKLTSKERKELKEQILKDL